MLCGYDTNYFLETIISLEGKRYSNIEGSKISRNISIDDVSGFFNTLLFVGEEHKSVVRFINRLQIVDENMIMGSNRGQKIFLVHG